MAIGWNFQPISLELFDIPKIDIEIDCGLLEVFNGDGGGDSMNVVEAQWGGGVEARK